MGGLCTKSAVISKQFTQYEWRYPQIKADSPDSLHFNLKPEVLEYRAKTTKRVTVPVLLELPVGWLVSLMSLVSVVSESHNKS